MGLGAEFALAQSRSHAEDLERARHFERLFYLLELTFFFFFLLFFANGDDDDSIRANICCSEGIY